MPTPGVIKLTQKMFPDLKDEYTATELAHMLIITGFDIGKSGLKLIQTIPELLKRNEAISSKDVSKLLYPIVRNALEKEYIHARVICLLNNSSKGENIDYCITAVFIADNNNLNFKLSDLYCGEPSQGHWETQANVKRFAESLSVPAYNHQG